MLNNPVRCDSCEKVITVGMSVRYHKHFNHFFCSLECAEKESFGDSVPFDMTEDNVRTKNLAIEDGKLHRVWREQYENIKKKGR